MSFSQWLRTNSQQYLLADAQQRIGRKNGVTVYGKPRSLKDRFWRYIFVPTYKILPDGLRRSLIHAMPGSHRQAWPKQSARPRPPHPFVRSNGQDRSPKK
ncbi:hypothetical protein [Nitrobacter sp. 62-23]|uniref:hypothetical protein n=1 Tax=Nitrobacter sp. 62-23 TaxID=1895798 RepID=UPI0009293C5F|nr:hypothetical protein [Nitrobacter sp. 62-23]OJV01716.1 MAG: hypothetical protein BGO16_09160 [Nitrobacter sp. 62-23]